MKYKTRKGVVVDSDTIVGGISIRTGGNYDVLSDNMFNHLFEPIVDDVEEVVVSRPVEKGMYKNKLTGHSVLVDKSEQRDKERPPNTVEMWYMEKGKGWQYEFIPVLEFIDGYEKDDSEELQRTENKSPWKNAATEPPPFDVDVLLQWTEGSYTVRVVDRIKKITTDRFGEKQEWGAHKPSGNAIVEWIEIPD